MKIYIEFNLILRGRRGSVWQLTEFKKWQDKWKECLKNSLKIYKELIREYEMPEGGK